MSEEVTFHFQESTKPGQQHPAKPPVCTNDAACASRDPQIASHPRDTLVAALHQAHRFLLELFRKRSLFLWHLAPLFLWRSLFQVPLPRKTGASSQTLPQETEATNLLALLRYRLKTYAHSTVIATVLEHLKQNSTMHLQSYAEYVAHQLDIAEPIVFTTLCHLLWHGELRADLKKLLIFDSAFAPGATVWLPGEEK
jgi:hypothetical protein